MYATKHAPVLVVDKLGRSQYSDLFIGNPKIIKYPRPHCQRLVNASGCRPYIEAKTDKRWIWKTYGPEPGEIFFTPSELAFARPYAGKIMIEPNGKNIGHNNKRWNWQRWQQLADRKIAPMVQCANVGGGYLSGVQNVATPSFRHAAAVLSVSRAFVGTEGGLHHAAAALGVPAVVLWSEFIDPSITGYPMHKNIRHAGAACGMRIDCLTCKASMEAITVNEVANALQEVLSV
jgi:ADP-heptose:LPS heptosyltransferase